MSTPPKLAQALLSLSIPLANRDPILGDFEEEFAKRKHNKDGSANLWYWRQAALSFPYFISGRIKTSPAAMQVLLIIISYLIFITWTFLAFHIFRLVYTTNVFKGSILLALSVRLFIESTGFFVAGALVRYGQSKYLPKGYKQNLWPIILILILLVIPTLQACIGAEHLTTKRYLLTKTIAIFPAVILGAYAVHFYTRNKH